MSKRKTTGITLNPVKKPKNIPKTAILSDFEDSKKQNHVRANWQGGVQMQTKMDKVSQLDEAEDEDLTKVMSSDEEDERYVLDKKGRTVLKKRAKKFTDDFTTLDDDENDNEGSKSISKPKGVSFNIEENKTREYQIDNPAKGEEHLSQHLNSERGRFEDDSKYEFTAFNMKEENEDLGNYDENTGNFNFVKDVDEKADDWLKEVSWKKVSQMDEKTVEKYKEKFKNDHEIYNSDGKITYSNLDVIESINKILDILLPHESVSMALKRLRPKNTLKKSQQNSMRNNKYSLTTKETSEVITNKDQEAEKAKIKLTILSDLANNVAGAGYYEVYQNSISQLEEYRDKLLSEISSKKTAKDDDLDMFGDDENEDSKVEQINADAFESVQWEYKWEDQGEDAEIFGPFDTKSIIEWKDAGYFATEMRAMCRKVGTTVFYDAQRLDFSLYE